MPSAAGFKMTKLVREAELQPCITVLCSETLTLLNGIQQTLLFTTKILPLFLFVFLSYVNYTGVD